MTGTLLERLISKYSHTRYSVAKKMAEIKLQGMEGEYDYKEELKKKTKNYGMKTTVSKGNKVNQI